MTKSADEVALAGELLGRGLSKSEVARRLRVSRATLRDWQVRGFDAVVGRRLARPSLHLGSDPLDCPLVASAPPRDYAYLLGLYLGDGCLSEMRREVFRLRIQCCDWYPGLMDLCQAAMEAVMPNNKVGRVHSIGCTELHSDSRHWICFFPQHGPGRKHERAIELEPWQHAIVDAYPHELIRGLIHSDGSRVVNRVRTRGKPYEYLRYFLSNESRDILEIFGDSCDALGIEWRFNRPNSISIARRASVARLDEFVGPKY
ncbi:MAG TPA: hypothetical protein VFA83_16450 [Acidimicrobiales bacterium]|nr:hypothetical protein [Acidimicrobiales bacterium]